MLQPSSHCNIGGISTLYCGADIYARRCNDSDQSTPARYLSVNHEREPRKSRTVNAMSREAGATYGI